ncbi:MAG: hypothetical protein MUD14_17390 [Hydrococcus sp. Prado102]|jgi:hypothetical protein|nr:hypothetical protein [Hydrococcus sp. Prado102]
MMVATLVNLKHESIDEEIENVLELYSDEFCQKLLAIPNFKQKLHSYVLNEIELDRVDNSGQQFSRSKVKLPYRSLELRLQLESFINDGIAYILGIDSQTLDRYIPRDYYVVFVPSH